jgi:putative ABC transport system ATP-binding protein
VWASPIGVELPLPALRRRTAAGGDRACAGQEPRLLLCDEPTGALDYATGRAILKLLQEMCAQRGITVVLITHNLALMPMGHRVITVKSGLVDEIIDNERPRPSTKLEW